MSNTITTTIRLPRDLDEIIETEKRRRIDGNEQNASKQQIMLEMIQAGCNTLNNNTPKSSK